MKCIVKDCENHEHEGKFIGDLCSPCHEFITTGIGVHSQAYRNTQDEANLVKIRKQIDRKIVYKYWLPVITVILLYFVILVIYHKLKGN